MGHHYCGAGEQIRSMPAACRRQLPGANDKVRENTRDAWLTGLPFVVTARRAKSQEVHRAKQLQVLERRDQLRQEWYAPAPQPLLPMQPLWPTSSIGGYLQRWKPLPSLAGRGPCFPALATQMHAQRQGDCGCGALCLTP